MIGQKVIVPRTGGSKTEGSIKAVIAPDYVLVEFPLGETLRGEKVPDELRGKTGTKILHVDKVEFLKEE